MERTTETTAAQALVVARHFLSRWRDSFTRAAADDIAQDAVIEAWGRRHTVVRPERWGAFVRTVSRRQRYRALIDRVRHPVISLDAEPNLMHDLVMAEPGAPRVRIRGVWVSLEWCVEQLGCALKQLGSLNERIVRSYYEGFSCGELAERYSLPVESVKVRLHRSRNRIRKQFEGRVFRSTV